MSNSRFYKVVCTPPKQVGGDSEKIYKADSYKRANQIGTWFVDVEWEGFGATYQIVPISEAEWKALK